MKEYRNYIFLIFLTTGFGLVYYFHYHITTTNIAIGHFFYGPIALLSLWGLRKGLFFAISMALVMLIIHFRDPLNTLMWSDLIRTVMFITVSLIVGILSKKSFKYQEKLKSVNLNLEKEYEKTRQAMLELNQSRLFLENVLNTTPSGVFTIDNDKRITSWNRTAEKITGIKKEEVLGKTCKVLTQNDHCSHCMIFDDSTSKPGEYTESVIYNNKGQKIYTMKNFDLLHDTYGNVIGGIESFIDISGQIKSMKIQKIIYEISRAGSKADNIVKYIRIIKDHLGEIIDTTNFFVTFYDQKTDTISLPYLADEKDKVKEFPAGKTLTKYVIDTNKPLLATPDIIRELEKNGDIEIIGTLAKVWLGVPLRSNGTVYGTITVQNYHDENAFNIEDKEMLEFISQQISTLIERKKNELNLTLALEKAMESDRLKTAFLANLSHEIRTPLNGIISLNELLSDANISAKERLEFIELVNKNIDLLLGLINNILEISKIETGSLEIHESVFSLNNLLRRLHNEYNKKIIHEKKWEVKLQMSPYSDNEDFTIIQDEKRLEQVFCNLLNNAVKFTDKGNIAFGIRSSDDKTIQFYVSDTGIGINKKNLGIIFHKFRQVDDSTTRKYGGLGVGLTIANSIIHLMGGKLQVESKLNEGSTFYFDIPLKTPARNNEPGYENGCCDTINISSQIVNGTKS